MRRECVDLVGRERLLGERLVHGRDGLGFRRLLDWRWSIWSDWLLAWCRRWLLTEWKHLTEARDALYLRLQIWSDRLLTWCRWLSWSDRCDRPLRGLIRWWRHGIRYLPLQFRKDLLDGIEGRNERAAAQVLRDVHSRNDARARGRIIWRWYRIRYLSLGDLRIEGCTGRIDRRHRGLHRLLRVLFGRRSTLLHL